MCEDPALLRGRRWALLSNQASVTTQLVPARRALMEALGRRPVRLFAPEHGLDGVAQDMESVADHVDVLTGVNVRSLYGGTEATLAPRDRDIEGLDVMVVDLQDVGTRYYTFAATMHAVMWRCAAAGVEVIVLDRPNPITGIKREGGGVDPGLESFVSQTPVPVRHGLTLGELALLLRRDRHPDLQLSVVPCRGWRRADWWDATGLPWVPPSPNMPTTDTALLYPGSCLIEATTLSEGRGTTRPFHLVGAPGIDEHLFADRLKSEALPGLTCRPARFRPAFGKHAGRVCSGVEIVVTQRDAVNSLRAGAVLLWTVAREFPGAFGWRDEPYEFVADVPAIDLLTGSDALRTALTEDGELEPVLARWEREAAAFAKTLDGVLLYR